MFSQNGAALELGDIQAGALMPRPNRYAGTYLAVRIDYPHIPLPGRRRAQSSGSDDGARSAVQSTGPDITCSARLNCPPGGQQRRHERGRGTVSPPPGPRALATYGAWPRQRRTARARLI